MTDCQSLRQRFHRAEKRPAELRLETAIQRRGFLVAREFLTRERRIKTEVGGYSSMGEAKSSVARDAAMVDEGGDTFFQALFPSPVEGMKLCPDEKFKPLTTLVHTGCLAP